MQTIVIGITGSIAAFKITELINILKPNYNIEVILTNNAKKLIDINELQSLCKVHTELFQPNLTYKDYIEQENSGHISLAEKADLIILAPATANTINKIANGIADNLLTTTILATKAKVLIAPAMNNNMYNNLITQKNIKKLNFEFIGPETGKLMCNKNSIGRMSEPKDIANKAISLLHQPLKNKKILITAGPTIEHIDPVRHITNKSSGKMGYTIAQTAKDMGAKVTLVTGPTNIEKPDVNTIQVETADEMYNHTIQLFPHQDIVICAAAVADYKTNPSKNKLKNISTITLGKNPDILKKLGELKTTQLLMGFALETNNLIENAKNKLKTKNCDLIIANTEETINSDTIKPTLITKNNTKQIEEIKKSELAKIILENENWN